MSNIQNTYDKVVKRIKSVKNIIRNDFLCNNSINEVIPLQIANNDYYIKFIKKFIFCPQNNVYIMFHKYITSNLLF